MCVWWVVWKSGLHHKLPSLQNYSNQNVEAVIILEATCIIFSNSSHILWQLVVEMGPYLHVHSSRGKVIPTWVDIICFGAIFQIDTQKVQMNSY